MTNTPPLCCLVLGNPAMVRRRIDALINTVFSQELNAMNCARHRADEDDESPFVGAQTVSMFAPRRLVIVSGMEKASVRFLENALSYCRSPNPKTTLVLHGASLPKRGPIQKLTKEIKSHGLYEKFDASKINPRHFFRSALEGKAIRFESAAQELVLQSCGSNLMAIENEIEKIETYMGERKTVSVQDVEAVCCLVAEASIWALTDALLRRNSNDALAALHRLLEDSKPPHQLLATITWQMRQLIELHDALKYRRSIPKSWSRMPRQKIEAARKLLLKGKFDPQKALKRLVDANRQFNSSKAGDRRNLEALTLSLCEH